MPVVVEDKLKSYTSSYNYTIGLAERAVGSELVWSRSFGHHDAVCLEHWTFNQMVVGSIPTGLTNQIRGLLGSHQQEQSAGLTWG